MHGPPPTPQEIQARLWRHVRRPETGGLPYREAILQAADELGLEPHKAFGFFGEADF
jgi:hypothetical protein